MADGIDFDFQFYVINNLEDTIISGSNAIALPSAKFFRALRTRLEL